MHGEGDGLSRAALAAAMKQSANKPMPAFATSRGLSGLLRCDLLLAVPRSRSAMGIEDVVEAPLDAKDYGDKGDQVGDAAPSSLIFHLEPPSWNRNRLSGP